MVTESKERGLYLDFPDERNLFFYKVKQSQYEGHLEVVYKCSMLLLRKESLMSVLFLL